MAFANSVNLDGLKIGAKSLADAAKPIGDGVALQSAAHPTCPACEARRLKQREAQKRYRAKATST